MARARNLTFDEIPELYDRTRPDYPTALFDDLISLSGVEPGARVLEIGCGTGQATVPLVERGFSVTCLEPGPSVARFAQAKLASYGGVEVACSTFEEWPLESEAFGLVVSAQAFHWVAPDVRFEKAAHALAPSGSLAVIGNAAVPRRSPLHSAIDEAYARHATSLVGPPATRWYAEEGPVPGLFAESGRFEPVVHRCYPWSRVYSPSDYCDLLRTHSDHRMLPPEQLEELLGAVSAAIQEQGQGVEVAYDAHLYLASRR